MLSNANAKKPEEAEKKELLARSLRQAAKNQKKHLDIFISEYFE